MSRVLKDEMSYDTGNGEVQFSVSIDFSTQSTYAPDAETQTISLGIPGNELLEDAERDMDEFTKNSINRWEDWFFYWYQNTAFIQGKPYLETQHIQIKEKARYVHRW